MPAALSALLKNTNPPRRTRYQRDAQSNIISTIFLHVVEIYRIDAKSILMVIVDVLILTCWANRDSVASYHCIEFLFRPLYLFWL